jgi:hypothetical protein
VDYHLKHGSFDLNEMTLTMDLKNSLDDEKKLLVVECFSAPSQRLGTGDLYKGSV